MEKELLFALISTLIYLVGIIPYWSDVIKGRTYPHPFTTGVWSVIVGFNTYVLFIAGEYYSFVPSLIMTFSLLFFGVGFGIMYFKKIHINWFDYLCLASTLLLLAYWWLSKNILHTVILTTIIDFIAFLPVFKKGWLQPWTETVFAYFMSGVNQIFTIGALSSPDLETSIFWIYMLVSNFIFCILVLYRRYSLKGWHSIFK
ncbi:hypothetical protein KBC86_03015 [Candidatus Gracilibacteria bacterium]|nr:hypothetical protein [Candidatus Gracilibacteria bacterium]